MTFRSYSSLHSHLDRVEEKLREKGYRRVFNSTRPLKPGEYLVRPVPNPDWPSTHEWVLEVETLPRIARRPAGGKGNDAPHPPRESVAAASRLAFEADSARSSSPTDCPPPGCYWVAFYLVCAAVGTVLYALGVGQTIQRRVLPEGGWVLGYWLLVLLSLAPTLPWYFWMSRAAYRDRVQQLTQRGVSAGEAAKQVDRQRAEGKWRALGKGAALAASGVAALALAQLGFWYESLPGTKYITNGPVALLLAGWVLLTLGVGFIVTLGKLF